MPKIQINGVNLYYEEHGSGSETIVFAHGFLTNTSVFREQINSLKKSYRCVAFDFRGQGRSQVAFNGYDMDNLACDAAKLLSKLNAHPCHFVGLSMGGYVGLRLALYHPELLVSLTLIDSSADSEPVKNFSKYAVLNFMSRSIGAKPVIKRAMPVVFSKSFLKDPSKVKVKELWEYQMTSMDRIGLSRSLFGILKRKSVEEELHKINIPTLIIVGEEDTATTPDKSEKMHESLIDSKLITIPNVGHCAPVEAPKIVNKALTEFYESLDAFTI